MLDFTTCYLNIVFTVIDFKQQLREKTAEEKEAEEAAADAEDEAQVINLYLLPHSLPLLQGQVQ